MDFLISGFYSENIVASARFKIVILIKIKFVNLEKNGAGITFFNTIVTI